MKKLSVIGAGNVGASTVQRLAESKFGDIVMLDVVPGLPQGKALDLMQAAPLMGYDVDIKGTNDYADIEGSDIVIITAGIARKPGMTRDDLLNINAKITRDVCGNIRQYAPKSIVLTVTNPLDIITYAAYKYTGFGKKRVFGMSGLLDSARFASFVAKEVGCSVKDVDAMVLGGHGDNMVPLPQYTTVSGIPVSEFLPKETIDRLVTRTIDAGAEIVSLLKEGSAFYAPSAAIVAMVDAIINDSARVIPTSVYLEGEYGFSDVCMGVPAKLGKNGVEKVIEIDLSPEQVAALSISEKAVRSGIEKLDLRVYEKAFVV
ncbi:MAG: Malate dehydrogenase [Methanomethylovorans sp. PtaU1.Bin093]|uniref:malate dehydrogenase n=1 Tax=Methanomethylovorans sp. PtaU1.Bin093 TaxID=1811679 RepID=UPI0009D35ADC|nr:malate dehydrogenase [Methanomethylovorans sp. PtaU1.Bin093]OPY21950.1 MAG: Malate dehydrogenase [Methanomethylovorans sp. PtaU1.Bin093]